MLNRPIFIIGAGAIGQFLGARLGNVTTLVTRTPAAARAIRAQGVTLDGTTTPLSAYSWDEITAFPSDAILLVTTKAFHLKEVVPQLKTRVQKGQLLAFCQNGLGILEGLSTELPGPELARGYCRFGATILDASRPHHLISGGRGRFELASLNRYDELLELVQIRTRLPVEWTPSIAQSEWKKALLNLVLNGLCSLMGVPNGEIASDSELRKIALKLGDEAIAVAQREGVTLTQSDLDSALEVMRATASNRNSMLQDLEAGRLTEMPWLNWEVAKRGARLGVPTPTHEMIASLVTYLEKSKLRARAASVSSELGPRPGSVHSH